jgi:hypothetical protein
LPGPHVTAAGIDPQRPNTLFGGVWVWDSRSHGGLFKSVDGALTWKATGLQANGNGLISCVAVDSRNSMTVYAAIVNDGTGSHGLRKSTNGGINWRNLLSALKYSSPGRRG